MLTTLRRQRRPWVMAQAETGEAERLWLQVAAPEAPTKPVEAPTEVPTRQEPPDRREGDKPSEPDIDEQIKRILREIPDPTPQPGGE